MRNSRNERHTDNTLNIQPPRMLRAVKYRNQAVQLHSSIHRFRTMQIPFKLLLLLMILVSISLLCSSTELRLFPIQPATTHRRFKKIVISKTQVCYSFDSCYNNIAVEAAWLDAPPGSRFAFYEESGCRGNFLRIQNGLASGSIDFTKVNFANKLSSFMLMKHINNNYATGGMVDVCHEERTSLNGTTPMEADDASFTPAFSTDHALDASNRGYRLLVKMGWSSGSGLGKHEQGIVEPVKMKENLVCLGLGKLAEYDKVTQLATKERRRLNAEMEETAEQVAAREAKGAKEEQLKAEVNNIRAAFYCQDCRKQYKTVTEMENHLSSYDHHHTKRLRQLQQQKRRVGTEEEQNVKRRKEQQQEELMLQRRIAAQTKAVGSSSAVKSDADKQEKPSTGTGTKVGFSFGGGMKVATKKPVKKALAVSSAFAFSQ
ncbi:G patch domain-containing protein 8 [Phytophthora citrophthora]|uniref:G patch domain-containing protein 8 n=1 Tax=Phytophthora citrophthora TaxID=4793 RepID=A0AAD9LG60_9STRA|nr:G patch domain-containing protein 8 [Phytophthora citrophthora]